MNSNKKNKSIYLSITTNPIFYYYSILYYCFSCSLVICLITPENYSCKLHSYFIEEHLYNSLLNIHQIFNYP